MATIDPNSLAFLLSESRSQPMHVAGMQLYELPDGASATDWARNMYEQAIEIEEVAPLFRKRPFQSIGTLGQWVWTNDNQFDIEHHVRHNALPAPGRIRELLELVGRLHSSLLARERPLWESHIIEGLSDNRIAMYTKLHHALVDGISGMRLLESVLSPDPDERDMPMPFDRRATELGLQRRAHKQPADTPMGEVSTSALRSALGIAADAAGLPGALIKSLSMGLRGETAPVSLGAPRTPFNTEITGARRFAADDWSLERIRRVARASGTTLNDVVLAMCSGAVRTYLLEQNALPDDSLVSMVPVALKSRKAESLAGGGGNAVGSVMVKLATNVADPEDRLRSIHESMRVGKEALSSMSPTQIMAMSGIGMAPALAIPLLRLGGVMRPPFNLIISNVPGPREVQYFNGAKLTGHYPVSVPMQGMALNITCISYADQLAFGLTGCRRSVPHLQRLLRFLDEEIRALELVVADS